MESHAATFEYIHEVSCRNSQTWRGDPRFRGRARHLLAHVGSAVLDSQSADDPVAQARNAAFRQGLQALGWMVGHNVQIEYRWASGDGDHSRNNAAATCRFRKFYPARAQRGRIVA